MDHLFDEFSKSLADSVPRRESLRRLGAVFAGAVLSPLGLETAWAGKVDACNSFCKCGNVKQQNQCLVACRKCNGSTSRLGGSCGSYVCCSVAACEGVCSNLKSDPNCGACGNNCSAYGDTCCGNYCADLKNDIFNCGTCGSICDAPGRYEEVACVSGTCVYDCFDGAVDCFGTCAGLNSDRYNCGACGNVCPDETPACINGTCSGCSPPATNCGGYCTLLDTDPSNCGACGFVCPGGSGCGDGLCSNF